MRPDTSPRIGYSRSTGTMLDAPSVTSAEDQDPGRMRDGHDEPEPDGGPQRASRADEIRGHDGLAVAGRERMERTEPECDRERHEQRDRIEAVALEERAELGRNALGHA